MRFKLRKRRIKHLAVEIVLFLPFFELMVFELFSKNGFMESKANMVMNICSVGRLLISFYYLLIKKHYWSYTAVGFAFFILSENIVSTINGSIYFKFFIGSFTTVGLCLLCSTFIHKSYQDYIDACVILFGSLSLCNAFQCYIMPGGFFNSVYKESAIYILGSKNTCFFFYIVFLYFLLYRQILNKERFNFKILLVILFLWGATFVSEAMNAFVMLTLLIVYYCIVAWGKRIYKLFSLKYLMFVIGIVALFVLMPGLRTIFNPILNLIGRDATITGRDVLWIQAIAKFKNSPIIGNGILTEYILDTGVVADHAHCHYLDILAKYGIVTFVVFVLTIIFVIKRAVSDKRKSYQIVALDCVFLGLLLLHSIIDHLELFNFIIVLISIELLPGENDILKITKNERFIGDKKLAYK